VLPADIVGRAEVLGFMIAAVGMADAVTVEVGRGVVSAGGEVGGTTAGGDDVTTAGATGAGDDVTTGGAAGAGGVDVTTGGATEVVSPRASSMVVVGATEVVSPRASSTLDVEATEVVSPRASSVGVGDSPGSPSSGAGLDATMHGIGSMAGQFGVIQCPNQHPVPSGQPKAGQSSCRTRIRDELYSDTGVSSVRLLAFPYTIGAETRMAAKMVKDNI
jgi:hypothetical protein